MRPTRPHSEASVETLGRSQIALYHLDLYRHASLIRLSRHGADGQIISRQVQDHLAANISGGANDEGTSHGGDFTPWKGKMQSAVTGKYTARNSDQEPVTGENPATERRPPKSIASLIQPRHESFCGTALPLYKVFFRPRSRVPRTMRSINATSTRTPMTMATAVPTIEPTKSAADATTRTKKPRTRLRIRPPRRG